MTVRDRGGPPASTARVSRKDAMAHLPRSRAATLGRTGDTSDAGGEVEHRILASAEQSLLASLAKQRISNATAPPKIFAKTVLRSPDDPTFQGAHFGEGAAEVRALSERDNCANPWDGVHRVLPGAARLRSRTRVRHERVLAAWRGERERLADVARARVATAVGMLRDAIATSDASLAEGTRVYDDDASLVELTTDEARRVWDETVATHLRNRTTWIDNLEKDVASAATETREEMATALAHTVDALSAVAHASRGDVERFAAEATMEINADALEDRRGVAELLARLRTREIERERSERTAYDAALVRWRTLRTERGVSLFAELIQSERMSDNPEREAITRELAEDQVKARDSLLAHANAFKALLPGRGDDGGGGGGGSFGSGSFRFGVEMNPVGVKRWAAGLLARCDAWDGACALGLKRLEALERELRAEADEALSTVVDAVEEYAGPIMDGRAREKLVRKRCVRVYDERNADAAEYIERVRAVVEPQRLEWRRKCECLMRFARRVARVRDVHRREAEAIHESVFARLDARRAEHERVDAAKEGAFDAACEDIAVAADEAKLEAAVDVAHQRLDDIELNYRDFNVAMGEIARSNPKSQSEAWEEYQRRLCLVMRLVPNAAPRPEPEPEPEAAPEPEGGAEGVAEGGAEGEGTTTEPETGDKVGEEEKVIEPERNDGEDEDDEDDEDESAWRESDAWKVEDESEEGREWLTTSSGTRFAVWDSVYEHVFAKPPEPEPEPIEATTTDGEDAGETRAEAEAETPAEGDAEGDGDADTDSDDDREPILDEEGNPVLDEEGNPTFHPPPPPPPPKPIPHVQPQLDLAESDLLPVLVATRDALLDDAERHLELVLDRAERFAAGEIEDLRDELEDNLRSHRPRAGRLEETNARSRSSALATQRRRFDAHLARVARDARRAEDAASTAIAAANEEIDAQCAKITALKESLVHAASTKGLDIRGREELRELERVKARCAQTVAALRARAERNKAATEEANALYVTETLKTREEGGEYSPEVREEFVAKLARVDAAAAATKEEREATFAAMEERAARLCAEVHAAYEEDAPHHRKDLELIEAVDRCVSDAKSRLKALLANADEEAARLAREIELVRAIGDRAGYVAPKDHFGKFRAPRDEGVAVDTLRSLDRLRRVLLSRCKFVGILAPDTKIEPLAEVSFNLEDVEEEAPDEEILAKEAEAAAAAEAVKAASGGKYLKGWHTKAEEYPTVVSQMDELVEQCRERVKEAAEPYYADKEADKITRPEKIPAKLDDLAATKDAVVAEMRADAASHAEDAAATLRVQVMTLQDLVSNQVEAAAEYLLEESRRRVAEAMHAEAAKHSGDAKRLAGDRHRHRDLMRPQLALPSRVAERNALVDAETARGKEALEKLESEASAVAGAIAASAGEFARRLTRMSIALATLCSDLVTPADLAPDGPGADAPKVLTRKNLKQLRRMRHEAADGTREKGKAKRRDVANGSTRPHKERRWLPVDADELSPEACGYARLEIPPMRWPGDPPSESPPKPTADGAEEGEGDGEQAPEQAPEGEAADADADAAVEEEEEDDTPREGEVWGLDVMSVQVAVNARDRAFDSLRLTVADHLASHERSMKRRLQDEVLHKERWDQLVTRTESAHS